MSPSHEAFKKMPVWQHIFFASLGLAAVVFFGWQNYYAYRRIMKKNMENNKK
ncbi:hypothetical protein FPOAC2_08019 [Fusarium poae]